VRISRIELAVNYAVLVIFAIFALLPLVGVLVSAVTPSGEDNASLQLPSRVAVENFAQAWTQGHFAVYMRSSLIVAVIIVAVTSLLAIYAGFAFATFSFRGSTILFYVILLGMMIPVEGFVIPLYFDLRDLNLTGSYFSLILPQVAQSLGFATFWMRSSFRAFPSSVLEAARLDGAADRHVLWRVVLPSSLPAVLTMALLLFMWGWNEFMLALVMVSNSPHRTAPLGLTFFKGQYTTSYNLTAPPALSLRVRLWCCSWSCRDDSSQACCPAR